MVEIDRFSKEKSIFDDVNLLKEMLKPFEEVSSYVICRGLQRYFGKDLLCIQPPVFNKSWENLIGGMFEEGKSIRTYIIYFNGFEPYDIIATEYQVGNFFGLIGGSFFRFIEIIEMFKEEIELSGNTFTLNLNMHEVSGNSETGRISTTFGSHSKIAFMIIEGTHK